MCEGVAEIRATLALGWPAGTSAAPADSRSGRTACVSEAALEAIALAAAGRPVRSKRRCRARRRGRLPGGPQGRARRRARSFLDERDVPRRRTEGRSHGSRPGSNEERRAERDYVDWVLLGSPPCSGSRRHRRGRGRGDPAEPGPTRHARPSVPEAAQGLAGVEEARAARRGPQSQPSARARTRVPPGGRAGRRMRPRSFGWSRSGASTMHGSRGGWQP